MATINYVQARKICTPEELQIVEATRRDALTKLGVADVKKHITLARRLRNKWRDLATSQRRRSQAAQNARVTQENQRSQQKAELFDEVLNRLEKQLASLAETTKGAPSKESAARKPPKQVRATEHRAQRAEVRKKLEEKRGRMTKAKTAASPSSASAGPSQSTPAAQPAAAPTGDQPAQKPKKKPAKAAKKKPARKKPVAKPSISGAPASKTSPASTKPALGAASPKATKQVRAKAAAKKARVQTSGMTTRIRGHVSARGKRSQSRRDSRG